MNRSEHYDLYLVEGSDTFNPLITDVPNFEAIDSAMFAIEESAIATATELVSGTVHALTRQGNGNVFKFVATGNAKAGDTYTVDGLQVSALLPSGETLADGAYVINSTVICALNGTVLTFYLGGGVVSEAEDSKKLGGQLPAYYGTASDVEQAVTTASAAQQLVIGMDGRVTALEGASTIRYNAITDTIQLKLADGTWADWRQAGMLKLKIYDNGTVYDDGLNTGSSSGSVTFNATNIRVYESAGYNVWGWAGVCTKVKVDVSGYSKLTIKAKASKSDANLYAGISSGTSLDDISSFAVGGKMNVTGTSTADYIIDLAGVTGEYYVKLFTKENRGTPTEVTVYEIILE